MTNRKLQLINIIFGEIQKLNTQDLKIFKEFVKNYNKNKTKKIFKEYKYGNKK